MKTRAVQILVVTGLVALALLLRKPARRLPETPEDAVNAFFDAATRGDDEAYLALVDGELRESLRNTRSQVGAEAFRRDLRKSVSGIKGLAIARSDAPGEQVALEVEIVFAGRKERQQIVVSPRGRGWIITTIGPAEAIKPAIPYGTPVFQE
jgi:hypothetical protein